MLIADPMTLNNYRAARHQRRKSSVETRRLSLSRLSSRVVLAVSLPFSLVRGSSELFRFYVLMDVVYRSSIRLDKDSAADGSAWGVHWRRRCCEADSGAGWCARVRSDILLCSHILAKIRLKGCTEGWCLHCWALHPSSRCRFGCAPFTYSNCCLDSPTYTGIRCVEETHTISYTQSLQRRFVDRGACSCRIPVGRANDISYCSCRAGKGSTPGPYFIPTTFH